MTPQLFILSDRSKWNEEFNVIANGKPAVLTQARKLHEVMAYRSVLKANGRRGLAYPLSPAAAQGLVLACPLGG